ncbi:MAG: hypothetical protein GWO24_31065, partial [Akkermansiaceae bacterium]|nr:hypothetical protein [Akkermansiaceae bacterium]
MGDRLGEHDMADLKRVRLPGGTLIWEPDEENEDDAFTFSDLIGRAVSEGGFDIVRHRSCGHLYIDPDWVDHPIEDCPVCREFQRSRLAVIDVPD